MKGCLFIGSSHSASGSKPSGRLLPEKVPIVVSPSLAALGSGAGGPEGRLGRPPASSELRAFIPRLAVANPYGSAPRLHGELLKLGRPIAERTVSRFMPKKRKPFPDLEGFPEQPCPGSRRGRLPHRADGQLSGVVGV
jgi:hypothetical protein